MMKRITLHFSVLMLLCVTSCSPVLYSTVGQNVPLFTDKGEASVGVAYASTNHGEGVSLQASGALTDHFAVLGSFYSLSESNPSADGWSGKGSYVELAAGYFTTLNTQRNIVLEVFGGIGSGGIKNDRGTSKANVNFFKPFIQPSIGYTGKWFEAAFTPRIGLVSYTDHEFVWSDPDEATILEYNFEQEKNTVVFEPGLTLRTGYKGIKLQVQYSYTTFDPFTADENGNKPNVNTDFISVGVSYLISKRYKQDSKQ